MSRPTGLDPVPTDASPTNIYDRFRRHGPAINLILRGKIDAVADITLTASDTTTVMTDSRIGFYSFIALMPKTESAATAQVAGIYIVTTTGSATVTHASNAATDQDFRVLIIG